jgi:predicted DNA-binding protein (MmcQ/YjbR family)
MNIETLYHYLAAMPGATEDFPFGEDTLVMKVRGKMFALVALDAIPTRVNLKCDPLEAIRLRERHAAVRPGYHMNKKHWNTVVLDGSLPTDLLQRMIDDSYRLVVANLPKREQAALRDAGKG